VRLDRFADSVSAPGPGTSARGPPLQPGGEGGSTHFGRRTYAPSLSQDSGTFPGTYSGTYSGTYPTYPGQHLSRAPIRGRTFSRSLVFRGLAWKGVDVVDWAA
jgi:hypothetical protein